MMPAQPAHETLHKTARPGPISTAGPHRRSSLQTVPAPRSAGHASSLAASHTATPAAAASSRDSGSKRPKLEPTSPSSPAAAAAAVRRDSSISLPDVLYPSLLPVSTPPASSPTPYKLAPFPPRPARPTHVRPAAKPPPRPGPSKREDVPLKPYTLDTPKSAPRLTKNVVADFRPWRGRHSEDLLSEATIKNGNFDKVSAAQNETSSARGLLWPGLKHKSGISLLSGSFVAVLEQRCAAAAVVAPNSFKPPPRVTLTDAKREGWLRDLADPTIPLRRLSRSIPHGMRGRPLLDHCLAKRIPTWRAIWLAKCVGANELRASKRKGTTGAFASGGESKWVRDWTVNVQQFLESLVAACGTDDWKGQMTYGLQLIAHLHADHLLDEDYFLEQLVHGLMSADEAHVPVWLLAVRPFWADIAARRRRGRLLAQALCQQLLQLREHGEVPSIMMPLWTKLAKDVRSLVVESSTSFILPEKWPHYLPILRACDEGNDPIYTRALKQLVVRNRRAARPSLPITDPAQMTDRQQLIRMLDATRRATYEFSELADTCLATMESAEDVVMTVVQWATTPYRTGRARLYLAARLLRRWSRQNVNLTETLRKLIADEALLGALSHHALQLLLADLSRSNHFKLGDYLQWFIARGTFTFYPLSSGATTFEIGLLCNSPLIHLERHVLNLRAIILTRAGLPVTPTPQGLVDAKSFCASKIPFVAASWHPDATAPGPIDLAEVDRALQLHISAWIWGRLTALMVRTGDEMDEDDISRPSLLLSAQDFHGVEEVYQLLDDYATLADIHGLFIEHCDLSILHEIADAINYHFHTFYAIGAATRLFRKLLERLVPGRGAVGRPLFAALLELARRFPNLDKTVANLTEELANCEPTSAMAMCSPVADPTAEILPRADSTFFEEVEMALDSGTSMDPPALARLYTDIMARLDRWWLASGPIVSYVELLSKLRAFGSPQFDELMARWLQRTLQDPKRPHLEAFVVPMVCGGVLTLADVFHAARSLLASHGSSNALAVDALRLVAYDKAPAELKYVPRAYRYDLSRQELVVHQVDLLATLIKAVVDGCSSPDASIAARARVLVTQSGFIDLLLQSYVSSDIDAPMSLEQAWSSEAPEAASFAGIDAALHFPLDAAHVGASVLKLLPQANDFNQRLCALRLSSLTRTTAVQQAGSGNNSSDFATRLVDRLASLDSGLDHGWRGLLARLPADVCRQALGYAMDQLLARIDQHGPSLAQAGGSSDWEVDATLRRWQGLLAAWAAAVPPASSAPLLDKLAEFLQRHHHRLRRASAHAAPGIDPEDDRCGCRPIPAEGDPRAVQYARVCFRITMLLDATLTLRHAALAAAPAAPAPSVTSPTSAFPPLLTPRIRIAAALATLVTEHEPRLPNWTAQRAADALALWSDALGPDELQTCMAGLPTDRRRDPRVMYALAGVTEEEAAADQRLLLAVPVDGNSAGGHAAAGDHPAGDVRMVDVPLRHWEMVPDATPHVGENDAPMNLSLFAARRAVL